MSILLAKNPKNHPRTKQIDIQYYYIQENGEMIEDGLTKAFTNVKMKIFIKLWELSQGWLDDWILIFPWKYAKRVCLFLFHLQKSAVLLSSSTILFYPSDHFFSFSFSRQFSGFFFFIDIIRIYIIYPKMAKQFLLSISFTL